MLSPNKIILIGFPGVGKTTIAKKLANILSCGMIDMDQDFENHYKTNISVFIHKYGEVVFRKCEYERLKVLLSASTEMPLVISTGGGTPCFFDAMEQINEQAVSIYVKMSEKSIFVRLTNAKKKRPLVQHKEEDDLREYIHNTLSQREPYYEKADIVVKGEDIDVEELAWLIRRKWENPGVVPN
ncbi:MAG: shikimate kinase [Bacteroidales bacterium]|jgi:shikimate kinase|nr:shikimate kinase [Bacteroidales bacterium]